MSEVLQLKTVLQEHLYKVLVSCSPMLVTVENCMSVETIPNEAGGAVAGLLADLKAELQLMRHALNDR